MTLKSVLIAGFAAALFSGTLGNHSHAADGRPAGQEMLELGLRGVYFVPNQGQWSDTEVTYGLRSRGLDVAFRESALTMHLSRKSDSTSRAGEEAEFDDRPELMLQSREAQADRNLDAAPLEHLTLTVTFPGSNDVEPVGAQPQGAKFNYFVGGEGRGVASDVPSYAAVVYENLYDGVDLRVMGNDDGVLKYEFHVAPGADYNQIRIHYDGIDSLCIDDAGDLHISTALGTLSDAAPTVWQEVAGKRCALGAQFEVLDSRTYSIRLADAPDARHSIIIDPEIDWMIYLGGLETDVASTMALDGDGNAFLTGWTDSTDFEGRGNAYHGGDLDMFLAKVSPDSVLLWMLYCGGSAGERGYNVAVDADGDALVVGPTQSADFEGRTNAHHGGVFDAFAVKVSAAGSPLWMTYLGGAGEDGANGLAITPAGTVLVTGETSSTGFVGGQNQFRGGLADVFVLELSEAGSVEWMKYLGGSGQDSGQGIATDRAGSILLTGLTDSPDFEARNNSAYGAIDGFVAKTTSDGSINWMTYFGGSRDDTGYVLFADDAGEVFVGAMTESDDLHGRRNETHGGERDAVAMKLTPAGAFKWMLHLGGTGRERGRAIAPDGHGGLILTGGTTSVDFEGQINPHHGGEYDAWVARVGGEGYLRWMTFLGGSGDDWGRGIGRLDTGELILGGITASPDFEGRINEYRGGGLRDSFIARFVEPGPRLAIDATCPSGGAARVEWQGASPNGTVTLIYASSLGHFRIPPGYACSGTELGLSGDQISVAFQGSAGPTGSRILDGTTGAGACGRYLQLLDVRTCETSNVALIE